MRFFVEKQSFARELKSFQGVFEKKSLMEHLKNIKIVARKETQSIDLMATDLEIGLSSTFPCSSVEEDGELTVGGRELFDLISVMRDGRIELLERGDLMLEIFSEKKSGSYKLPAMGSSDFPKLPDYDPASGISIPLEILVQMIHRNYYIISPEIKFNLAGAVLSVNREKMEMAATDGHRLSLTEYYWPEPREDESFEFIVSRKTLLEILKLEGNEPALTFGSDSNNLFFSYGDRLLSSRIIDQKFPNFRSVIPESSSIVAVLDTQEFMANIKRVMVIKGDRTNRILMTFSRGKLVLEKKKAEMGGEAREEMEIRYDGETVPVAFNGGYILDFLTHVDSQEVLVEINPGGSYVFKPYQEDEKKRQDVEQVRFIYVAMPLTD